MPRYAGLVNIDVLDDVVDRMLAFSQDFYDAEPSRISQGLEHLYMHHSTYVSLCIYNVKAESLRERGNPVMGTSPRNRTAQISAPLRSAQCAHPAQSLSPETRFQRVSPWKRPGVSWSGGSKFHLGE
jgi:hypothetical protein